MNPVVEALSLLTPSGRARRRKNRFPEPDGSSRGFDESLAGSGSELVRDCPSPDGEHMGAAQGTFEMVNSKFYSTIFPSFWDEVDHAGLVPDEQSMFADEAVFDWLIDTFKPLEIVEVGSWKGHSANYMIDRCKKNNLESRIVCIDTFLGGPEHWIMAGAIETLHRKSGRPTIFERFLANTLAAGNANRVFPLTADSLSGSEILKYHNFRADLVFLDGAHDPDNVRSDILRYFPLLSENGVMFGDDYQYEPLARTVHQCAAALGVQVLVCSRKWIFCNEAFIKRVTLPNMQMRSSFDGWVHP